ncbi:hypothetical protein IHE44_0000062 [Lamprotornis superbus]|uniref:Atypical chemokine receptor 2 n=1 Tax=Lamprotornis superbus TaxID=245042 RepID=A0A835NPV5_9PASS|nr:hypothetical protein IHE44_0000062 [Lamprotornis superbus]
MEVASLGWGLIPEVSPPFHSEVRDGDVDASVGLMWREKDVADGEKESHCLELPGVDSHWSNITSGVTATTTDMWLGAANSSEYPYEYLDEEDYDLYGPCTKEEVLSFSRVFLPSFYTVIFLVGMAGNALLFTVLLMYIKKKKKMTELYLLNLVVSDFFLLLTLPFWALHISQWVTWDILCPFLNAMYTLNFYSGIFFVSCMSLDMYLRIVHACSPHSSTVWRNSILILLVMWILSIALSIPDGLFTSTRQFYNKTIMCTQDYGQEHLFWKVVFRVIQNTLGFLFPFLFMTFCYSRIACVLNTSQIPGSRRALCLVLTLVGVFFVLWCPYNVVLILHSLQDVGVIRSCESSRKLDYALQITESLSFVHCCLNPLLYAFVKKRSIANIRSWFHFLVGVHSPVLKAEITE